MSGRATIPDFGPCFHSPLSAMSSSAEELALRGTVYTFASKGKYIRLRRLTQSSCLLPPLRHMFGGEVRSHDFVEHAAKRQTAMLCLTGAPRPPSTTRRCRYVARAPPSLHHCRRRSARIAASSGSQEPADLLVTLHDLAVHTRAHTRRRPLSRPALLRCF